MCLIKDSLEMGMEYLLKYYGSTGEYVIDLDDDDIDIIQAILDQSDESENDDDDDVVLMEQGDTFPRPRKHFHL